MFRYHFLSHFLGELNEICCGSLLNSIIKTSEGNFFKHSDFFFIQHNLKCFQIFVVFFTQTMIKNVLCNKNQNTSVRFFIYMSYMCVQFCTAFEFALVSALKSKMVVISMNSIIKTYRRKFL